MRVAATLPMGGVDGLNKLRVHAKGPQGLQRNQKRGSAGGDHMQQSGRLYNQAVQLCIRPKEEIQLCFLKGWEKTLKLWEAQVTDFFQSG